MTLNGPIIKILIDYRYGAVTWPNQDLRNSGLVTPSWDSEKRMALDVVRISHNPSDVIIVPRGGPPRGPRGLLIFAVRDMVCTDGLEFKGGGPLPGGMDPAHWVIKTTSGAVKELRAATAADAVPGEDYYGCAVLELLTEVQFRVNPVLREAHWFSPKRNWCDWLLGGAQQVPPPLGLAWDEVTLTRMNIAGIDTMEHFNFLQARGWRNVSDSLDVLVAGLPVYPTRREGADPPSGQSTVPLHTTSHASARGVSSAVSPFAPAPSSGGAGGAASGGAPDRQVLFTPAPAPADLSPHPSPFLPLPLEREQSVRPSPSPENNGSGAPRSDTPSVMSWEAHKTATLAANALMSNVQPDRLEAVSSPGIPESPPGEAEQGALPEVSLALPPAECQPGSAP